MYTRYIQKYLHELVCLCICVCMCACIRTFRIFHICLPTTNINRAIICTTAIYLQYYKIHNCLLNFNDLTVDSKLQRESKMRTVYKLIWPPQRRSFLIASLIFSATSTCTFDDSCQSATIISVSKPSYMFVMKRSIIRVSECSKFYTQKLVRKYNYRSNESVAQHCNRVDSHWQINPTPKDITSIELYPNKLKSNVLLTFDFFR